MIESVSPVTDSSFDQDVLQSPLPVLVYFWANWSEECRPMAQLVNVVATEKRDRLKTVLLDVDSNPRMAALYCIAMVPTLILFISGKERQRIEGLTNKAHLASTIEMRISNADAEVLDQTSSVN